MALYDMLCAHIKEKDTAPKITADQLLPVALELPEMILTALQDPDTDARECFMRIEEIVLAYEKYGVYCGARHDFG